MRFKAFLLETLPGDHSGYMQNGLYRSKSITREQAIKLVRERCSKAMQYDRPLMFRGTDKEAGNKKESYQFTIPSLVKRMSANTANHYTVLFDNFESWKEYPARSESLIGTTAKGFWNAASYGSPFIVLPHDRAKIGVCTSTDLWGSFESACKKLDIGDLGDLSILIRELKDESKYPKELPNRNQDFELLKDCLDHITEWLQKNDDTGQEAFKRTFEPVISGDYTVYEYFEKLLNPEAAGFKLVDYTGLEKYVTKEREVWTDGDSILIAASEELATNEKAFLQFYTDFRNEVLK